ncbi:hypothetical protein SODALDRAFT_68927 [Sodiomyces alkalinus F11]|uniref:Uncharacterized protein n=1 Tax=Sodiomyces alkalinus (strain CBS 110278 / VKM F-3762 / F11) TaxID=1314773 RepID=A0A3N2PM16_SODAK|nr:hypothetical protein SODALDRAFT_68927 [Sodiomyces alkalinus F11]ROT35519.1 hypothetical protein SODALDRAFT_68927 [Sodiomyces alkalinus F11]
MVSDALKPVVGRQCLYPGCSSMLITSQRYCLQHQDSHINRHDQQQAGHGRSVGGHSLAEEGFLRSPERQHGRPRMAPDSYPTEPGPSMHPRQFGQTGPGLPVNSRLDSEFAQQATKTAKKTAKTSSVSRMYMAPSPRMVRTQPPSSRESFEVDSARFEHQSLGGQRISDATTRTALFSLHPSKGAGSQSFSHLRTPTEPGFVKHNGPQTAKRGTELTAPTTAPPKGPSSVKEDKMGPSDSRVNRGDAQSPSSTPTTGNVPSFCGFSSTRFAPLDIPIQGTDEGLRTSTNSLSNGQDTSSKSFQRKRLKIPAAVKRVPSGLPPRPLRAAVKRVPAGLPPVLIPDDDGTSDESESSQSPQRPQKTRRIHTPEPSLPSLPSANGNPTSSTTIQQAPPISQPAASLNLQHLGLPPHQKPANDSSRGSVASSVERQQPAPSTVEDPLRSVNTPSQTEDCFSFVGEEERILGKHNGGQTPSPPGATSHVSQEAHRLRKAATFDQAKFDAVFYGQELAGPPPSGVTVPPAKQKRAPPPGEDGKLYLNIDPRIHWPRRWTDEWYENKMKEIRARGGRKANWGRAAQRMREQRLGEKAQSQVEADAVAPAQASTPRLREPEPWMHHRRIDFEDLSEDELPDYVLENPAWARACAWMRSNAEERRQRAKTSAGEALRRILSHTT